MVFLGGFKIFGFSTAAHDCSIISFKIEYLHFFFFGNLSSKTARIASLFKLIHECVEEGKLKRLLSKKIILKTDEGRVGVFHAFEGGRTSMPSSVLLKPQVYWLRIDLFYS